MQQWLWWVMQAIRCYAKTVFLSALLSCSTLVLLYPSSSFPVFVFHLLSCSNAQEQQHTYLYISPSVWHACSIHKIGTLGTCTSIQNVTHYKETRNESIETRLQQALNLMGQTRVSFPGFVLLFALPSKEVMMQKTCSTVILFKMIMISDKW